MKSSVILVLLSVICTRAFSQDCPLSKGQIRVNGGLGLISFIKIAGGTTTFPPLTVSAEYAVSEDMTIGAIAGYTSTEQTYSYSSIGSRVNYTASHTIIGARANYYFDVDPKFEVYSGVMLGYNTVKAKLVSNSSYGFDEYNFGDGAGGILYGFQAGGRYRFSSFASAFAELGYGISVLNLGLTLHLGNHK